MSATPLVLVDSPQPNAWQTALQTALRPEFLATPLVAPPGSPLAPQPCGVAGCERAGKRLPWGQFEPRLCSAHAQRWMKAGRPAKEEWLSVQQPVMIVQEVRPCVVVGCRGSVCYADLCAAHVRAWELAGRPELSKFVRQATPRDHESASCQIKGCDFAMSVINGSEDRLCDSHMKRFHGWRSRHREGDRSVERFIDSLRVRVERAVRMRLVLPDASLAALELRFVLQHRHDHGEGLICPYDWRALVARLHELGLHSLLDHELEWWEQKRIHPRRGCQWVSYACYAWRTLVAFRVHCGLDDPWAPDVWHVGALPVDQLTKRAGKYDWRVIRPVWLRELCKRWARHRLRRGLCANGVYVMRRALVALVEFCEMAGWPLDDPGGLTRELFDAFLDHVRGLEQSADAKHDIAGAVKQLFEEAHDMGWISLRYPRVYLPAELPNRRNHLPRALPGKIVARLNTPEALEVLSEAERAAMLVLMDCGLRATDTGCLRLDGVITGSDGAPYLRYLNHKRGREAIVPISERAAAAIAVHRAWVREHFPQCEWLFPRDKANARGERPAGYAFVYRTLRRWAEVLDLRDEHGEPLRPSPHAFRHTYATDLVNNDVDLFSVQSLLDHDSPEMTWRYARMSKETLRRKWEEGQRRINIRGEIVPVDVEGELSDAAWAKEQISRAKQTLPNGWCGLPLRQSCPHPNACLTCPAFLTDHTFLSQHREQLERTAQLIELGQQNGNDRLVEINQATKVNLLAIIERAEQLEREPHDNAQQGTDDAAA